MFHHVVSYIEKTFPNNQLLNIREQTQKDSRFSKPVVGVSICRTTGRHLAVDSGLDIWLPVSVMDLPNRLKYLRT